jgi:hypothetical protein
VVEVLVSAAPVDSDKLLLGWTEAIFASTAAMGSADLLLDRGVVALVSTPGDADSAGLLLD